MEDQPYYNTTNQKGEALKKEQSTSKNQSEIILDVFNLHKSYGLTPFEVLKLSGINAPVTSIRRSITNLTNDGYLVKTDIKKEGIYGKPNYCWKLKPKENTQTSLFN